eukprot:COSAG02_NODE_3806_length_6203_cov_175.828637_2_plen_59_part_00
MWHGRWEVCSLQRFVRGGTDRAVPCAQWGVPGWLTLDAYGVAWPLGGVLAAAMCARSN